MASEQNISTFRLVLHSTVTYKYQMMTKKYITNNIQFWHRSCVMPNFEWVLLGDIHRNVTRA